MAEFLSAAWLEELDSVARDSTELAELGRSTPLVIEQRVTGTSRGEIAYHIVIDPQGARVVVGRAPAPQITLATDFVTASAIHRGEVNAQQALNAGVLKVGGEAADLLGRGDALKAVNDVFASVRATTTATG